MEQNSFEKLVLEKKLKDADNRRAELQQKVVDRNKSHMDHVFSVSQAHHAGTKSEKEIQLEMEIDSKQEAASRRHEQKLKSISSYNHEKVAHAKRVAREHNSMV